MHGTCAYDDFLDRKFRSILFVESTIYLQSTIIIGPTKYPQAMWAAFRDLLMEARVPEPEKKIVVSDIPLRR
jgi:hypothetical protein